MPARRETHKQLQRGKLKAVHPPVSESENSNVPAADFQVGPMNKSREMKKIPQSNETEDVQGNGIDHFEEKQTEMPALFELDEADQDGSKFDLEDLNYEIEDILVELEQLKAKVVPMMDRREFKPETKIPLATIPDSPSPASAPQFRVQPAGSSTTAVSREDWGKVEFSKTEIKSPGGFGRWKRSILALTAIILTGVFGYFFFFPAKVNTPASELNAENQRSETDRLRISSASAGDPAIQENSRAESSAATAAEANSGEKNAQPDGFTATRAESSMSAVDGSSAAKPKSQRDPSILSSNPRDSAVSSNPAIPSRLAISSPGISSKAAASASPASSPSGAVRRDLPGNSVEKRETALSKPAEVPIADLVMAESISRVKPSYPEQAMEQKISGIVEVEVDINEQGDVVRAKAISGPDLLRSAAEEALMKWKFKPATANGIGVASQALISIPFNLR
jgi:TonB family protein